MTTYIRLTGRFLWFCFMILLVFALPSHPCAQAAAPTHRYSFDGDANDSIGTRHGTLNGSAVITNGSLVINAWGGRLQLPGNLFTNSKSLTLEMWFVAKTINPGTYLWQFTGNPSIFYNAVQGSTWYSSGYYSGYASNSTVNSAVFASGRLHHLVWSQDQATHTARVYLNGALYAENVNFTNTPGTTSSSSYIGGFTSGSVAEFRIYSNGLTHVEVLQTEALGPDALPAPGDTATNLFFRTSSHVGLNSLLRPAVWANFNQQQNVNLTPLADLVFSSSDTNVLVTTTNGKLQAVGLGSAAVVATWNALATTTTVTVVTTDQFALAHRYDFDGPRGSTNLVDLVGNAPGTVMNGGLFTNGAQLTLDGVNDYVDLPDGILSSLSEVTMEAWVIGHGNNGKWWPRIFDFGSASSGFSGTYFFLAPCVQSDNLSTNTYFTRFAVSTNGIDRESPRLTAKPWMTDLFPTHFAVSYSPAKNSSKLYVNGALVASGPAIYPLSLIEDTNNWLGRSQFSGDAYFGGMFDEFRIYRTCLDASAIAASFALGPYVIGADYALHGQLSATNLTLAWGPSASWCKLETSPTLAGGGVWTNVATTPVFVNGRIEVTVPRAEVAGFFRLSPP